MDHQWVNEEMPRCRWCEQPDPRNRYPPRRPTPCPVDEAARARILDDLAHALAEMAALGPRPPAPPLEYVPRLPSEPWNPQQPEPEVSAFGPFDSGPWR